MPPAHKQSATAATLPPQDSAGGAGEEEACSEEAVADATTAAANGVAAAADDDDVKRIGGEELQPDAASAESAKVVGPRSPQAQQDDAQAAAQEGSCQQLSCSFSQRLQ